MILIVDDAPDARLLVRRFLESAGYGPIHEAESVAEAMAILRPREGSEDAWSPVDLILMDVVLPDEDGLAACRRICGTALLEDVAILVITSLPEPGLLEKAYEAGAWDFLQKPVDKTVLLARVRNALRLKREIDQRKARERDLLQMQSWLEEANFRLQRQALHDELTGLRNRRSFDEQFGKEWRLAARRGECLAVLMIDLDYFKRYNDHYLHQEGDRCLREVARAVTDAMFRPSDFVARYGGEEIVVILPHTNRDGARDVAMRIRHRVEALTIPHEESEAGPYVTVSIGGAWGYPTLTLDPAILVRRADQALYRAKESGRNRVVIEDEAIRSVSPGSD